eukprot:jgi/Mesvir1/1639/Mv02877-RA.1
MRGVHLAVIALVLLLFTLMLASGLQRRGAEPPFLSGADQYGGSIPRFISQQRREEVRFAAATAGGSTTPVTPQVPADEQNAPPTKERNSRARAIAGAVANEANRSLITNTYAPAMVVDVAGMALDAMGLGKVADVVTKPLDFMAKHTPIGALVNAFTDPKASAECKLLKFVSLGFGSCDKTGTSCVKGSCARDDYWKALYSGDEKALEKAKKLYDPDLPAVLQLDRAAPSGERKTVAPSSTLPMRGV